MNSARLGSIALICLALVACAIHQRVIPLDPEDLREVCIIENPAVRSGFLREYRRVLEVRGYVVRLIPEGSPASSCPLTSSYNARWSYDWFWTSGVYMSLAEIHVFRDGGFAAQAVYDSRNAPINPLRIIDAEPKIEELVEALFPPVP